jgi:uncharacterized protein (DUF427 family)
VSLTVGTGPFGHHPGGAFNFELPRTRGIIYFEESPRRIRATFGGETIVDSRHAKLLHEQNHLPVYYFPTGEVRMDLLEATDHTSRCPFKGEARYWSIVAGGRVAENAAWQYPDPLEGAPPLAGYVAFYWNKLDEWFEEDEPAIVHARDPYHRVDVFESSRPVVVRAAGAIVAETTRPKMLFETGVVPRVYVPRADVVPGTLEHSEKRTVCPYKGEASYWSIVVDGRRLEDAAWSYELPLSEATKVADHVSFEGEDVEVQLGEAAERFTL